MSDVVDPLIYSSLPKLSQRGALALATRLLRAAPEKPTLEVKRKLTQLREAAVQVKEQRKDRARRRPESLRPLDQAFDSAWTAVRDRMLAWTRVADPRSETLRKRAEALLAAYFPEGVSFVLLSLDEEWIESQERIERWTEEKARPDFVQLTGEEFVANVELQHKLLGEAIGMSGQKRADLPSSTGVAEAIKAVTTAIAGYGRVLAGQVDEESADSIAAFEKAMSPIAAYRAATGSKEEDTEEEKDADGPLPPLPGEPATPDAPSDGPRIEPGMPGADPFQK